MIAVHSVNYCVDGGIPKDAHVRCDITLSIDIQNVNPERQNIKRLIMILQLHIACVSADLL
jgi:hypothetical protein